MPTAGKGGAGEEEAQGWEREVGGGRWGRGWWGGEYSMSSGTTSAIRCNMWSQSKMPVAKVAV